MLSIVVFTIISLIVNPPVVEKRFLVLILKSTFDSGPAFLLILSPSVRPLLVLPSTFASTLIIFKLELLDAIEELLDGGGEEPPPDDEVKVPQLLDEVPLFESVAVKRMPKAPEPEYIWLAEVEEPTVVEPSPQAMLGVKLSPFRSVIR